MTRVTSTEFQKNVGRFQDQALTDVVRITHHGRDRLVLISAAEYDRLKRRDRVAMKLSELTAADIEAIAAAEVPPGNEHLNQELVDDA